MDSQTWVNVTSLGLGGATLLVSVYTAVLTKRQTKAQVKVSIGWGGDGKGEFGELFMLLNVANNSANAVQVGTPRFVVPRTADMILEPADVLNDGGLDMQVPPLKEERFVIPVRNLLTHLESRGLSGIVKLRGRVHVDTLGLMDTKTARFDMHQWQSAIRQTDHHRAKEKRELMEMLGQAMTAITQKGAKG